MLYYFYYEEDGERIYVIGTGKIRMMDEREKSVKKEQKPEYIREIRKGIFKVYVPLRSRRY